MVTERGARTWLARLRNFLRSGHKAKRLKNRLIWMAVRAKARLTWIRQVRNRKPGEIHLRNGLVFVNVDHDVAQAFEGVWIRRDYSPRGFSIHPRDTVIDIGAHAGVFALYAAQRASEGRVICYEPSPHTFRLLQENLRRNHLTNVTAHNLAVAGEAGKRSLFIRQDLRMGTSLYEDNFCRESPLPTLHEVVRCVTLEDVFLSNQISICNFLKLDCERAEYEILRRAPGRIWTRIRQVAMEYHVGGEGENAEAIRRLLVPLGFQVRYRPFRETNLRGLLYARRHADHG